MSISPVNFPEFIRFYERVAPDSLVNRTQNNSSDRLNISAEAKKKLVFKQAFSEVLEKIKKK
jgi:hypothetical protein